MDLTREQIDAIDAHIKCCVMCHWYTCYLEREHTTLPKLCEKNKFNYKMPNMLSTYDKLMRVFGHKSNECKKQRRFHNAIR